MMLCYALFHYYHSCCRFPAETFRVLSAASASLCDPRSPLSLSYSLPPSTPPPTSICSSTTTTPCHRPHSQVRVSQLPISTPAERRAGKEDIPHIQRTVRTHKKQTNLLPEAPPSLKPFHCSHFCPGVTNPSTLNHFLLIIIINSAIMWHE